MAPQQEEKGKMRYLIADLVTEYEPKYDSLKKLAEPFVYEGDRATDICIGIDEARRKNKK